MTGVFFGGPKRLLFLKSYLKGYIAAQKTVPNSTHAYLNIVLARYFRIFVKDLEVDPTGRSKIRVGREKREEQICHYFNNHSTKGRKKAMKEEDLYYDSDTEDDDISDPDAKKPKSPRKKTQSSSVIKRISKMDRNVIFRALLRGGFQANKYSTPPHQVYQHRHWERIKGPINEAYSLYCKRMQDNNQEPKKLLWFQNHHARFLYETESDKVKEEIQQVMAEAARKHERREGESDESFLARTSEDKERTMREAAANIGDLVYDFITVVYEETGHVGIAYFAGEDPEAPGNLKCEFIEKSGVDVNDTAMFSKRYKKWKKKVSKPFKEWAIECIPKELVDPTEATSPTQPQGSSSSKIGNLSNKNNNSASAEASPNVGHEDSSDVDPNDVVVDTKPRQRPRLYPKQKFSNPSDDVIDLCSDDSISVFKGNETEVAAGKSANPFIIDSDVEELEVNRDGPKTKPHYEEMLCLTPSSEDDVNVQEKLKGKAVDKKAKDSTPSAATSRKNISTGSGVSNTEGSRSLSRPLPRIKTLADDIPDTPTPTSKRKDSSSSLKARPPLPTTATISMENIEVFASLMEESSITDSERKRKLDELVLKSEQEGEKKGGDEDGSVSQTEIKTKRRVVRFHRPTGKETVREAGANAAQSSTQRHSDNVTTTQVEPWWEIGLLHGLDSPKKTTSVISSPSHASSSKLLSEEIKTSGSMLEGTSKDTGNTSVKAHAVEGDGNGTSSSEGPEESFSLLDKSMKPLMFLKTFPTTSPSESGSNSVKMGKAELSDAASAEESKDGFRGTLKASASLKGYRNPSFISSVLSAPSSSGSGPGAQVAGSKSIAKRLSLSDEIIKLSLDARDRERAQNQDNGLHDGASNDTISATIPKKSDIGMHDGNIEDASPTTLPKESDVDECDGNIDVVSPATYPKHFEAPEAFLRAKLGEDFGSLLQKWIRLESLKGFPEDDGKINMRLRPTVLGAWNRGRRSFRKLPEIRTMAEFATGMRTFYDDVKMQKVVDEGEEVESPAVSRTKIVDGQPANEDWTNLAVGGRYGFQIILIGLAFGWMDERVQTDKELREVFQSIAVDAERVLDWILSYLGDSMRGEKRSGGSDDAEGSTRKKVKFVEN